ncbi:MAG: hypothetical protein IT428_07585 [Planctomycetaceae bacterium]|nr:hypothetical protein [Planctomycetaceae bacterium]
MWAILPAILTLSSMSSGRPLLADEPIAAEPVRGAVPRAAFEERVFVLPPIRNIDDAMDVEELGAGGDVEDLVELNQEMGFQFSPDDVEMAVIGDVSDRSQFRNRQEEEIARQIQRIESAFPLPGPMRRKLEMAARGDVARFYEDLDRLKRDVGTQRLQIDDLQKFQQQCMELNARAAGSLHGSDSLFQKTFRSILDPDLKNRLEIAARKAARKEHTERIDKLFEEIDRVMSLKAAQREKLHALFTSRIKPPKVDGLDIFETASLQRNRPQQGFPTEFLQSLAAIPDDEYQKIVTERQWTTLHTLIARYRKQAQRQQIQQIQIEAEAIP